MKLQLYVKILFYHYIWTILSLRVYINCWRVSPFPVGVRQVDEGTYMILGALGEPASSLIITHSHQRCGPATCSSGLLDPQGGHSQQTGGYTACRVRDLGYKGSGSHECRQATLGGQCSERRKSLGLILGTCQHGEKQAAVKRQQQSPRRNGWEIGIPSVVFQEPGNKVCQRGGILGRRGNGEKFVEIYWYL